MRSATSPFAGLPSPSSSSSSSYVLILLRVHDVVRDEQRPMDCGTHRTVRAHCAPSHTNTFHFLLLFIMCILLHLFRSGLDGYASPEGLCCVEQIITKKIVNNENREMMAGMMRRTQRLKCLRENTHPKRMYPENKRQNSHIREASKPYFSGNSATA